MLRYKQNALLKMQTYPPKKESMNGTKNVQILGKIYWIISSSFANIERKLKSFDWLGFIAYQSNFGSYLMSNPVYTHTHTHIYICIYIYIFIYLFIIWFGWDLWNINHCRLFNVKSCLHTYNYDLVWLGFMAYQPL